VAPVAAVPVARADAICTYPAVGSGSKVFGVHGGWCDYPTEINGSHLHCEGGGVDLGIGGSGQGDAFSISGAGQGVGIASCTWRCPDGVMAPAPNPPGAWKQYLVPMTSTNWCRDHMAPDGFWGAGVLPTEGLPPVNEQPPAPGEVLPPQPVPPPEPTPVPGVPLVPATAPPAAPDVPNP
jgi:hypothetical protein